MTWGKGEQGWREPQTGGGWEAGRGQTGGWQEGEWCKPQAGGWQVLGKGWVGGTPQVGRVASHRKGSGGWCTTGWDGRWESGKSREGIRWMAHHGHRGQVEEWHIVGGGLAGSCFLLGGV